MVSKILRFFPVILYFPSILLAASFDANIHSDAIRATYANTLAPKIVFDLGAIKFDNNQTDEIGLHTGINFVTGKLRFGVRALYIAPGNTDLLAAGIGGQGQFSFNKQVSIGGHFYIAPEALSFMDSAGYREFAGRLYIKVAKKFYTYIGYRNIKVAVFTTDNKIELDDDLHIGIKVFF